jgi:DNA gyrase subunit A
MLISSTGNIIRMRVSEIPILHRSTQGVRLIELGSEESLVGIARVAKETESKEEEIAEEDTTPEETEGEES